MSKLTKEKIRRLPGEGAISSEEEYIAAKIRLETYIKEYNWLKMSKDPVKETVAEAQKIIPMIKKENSDSQRYFQNYSNFLINKKNLIIQGEYGSVLMKNIMSLFIQTKQYEIDSKDYSLRDIIKGVFTRNKEVLEDLKLDRLFSKIRIWEGIPKETDISMQPVKDIMRYISKYYDIVGINIEIESEAEENKLPALSDGYLSPAQAQLIDLVNSYIAKYSIDKELQTKASNVEKEEKSNRDTTTKELDSDKESNAKASNSKEVSASEKLGESGANRHPKDKRKNSNDIKEERSE